MPPAKWDDLPVLNFGFDILSDVTGLSLKGVVLPIKVSQRSPSLHLLIDCLTEEKELNLQCF